MYRVLHITFFDLGGVEVTLMNYYRHINKAVIQFDFYIRDDDAEKKYYEDEAISLGANVYRFPNRNTHIIKDSIRVFRFFKNHPEINIIHIHRCRPTFYMVRVLLAAKLAGIPVRIVCSHNDVKAQHNKAHHSIVSTICKPIIRLLATHLTACSEIAGVSMFGKRVKDKVVIIPNARDFEVFRYDPQNRKESRKKMNLLDNYVIIHIGRLEEQKNHIFLLEIFAQSLKKEPNMLLLIVGDGSLRAKLLDKAKVLGINDKVRFLGSRDDVPDLLQAADIFVLPSLYEGLPGVAIEAQAAGLPCLLADTISRETAITDLVAFLPINEGVDVWVDRLAAYRYFNRKDTAEEISRAGYEICDATKRLEEYYIKAASGLRKNEAVTSNV